MSSPTEYVPVRLRQDQLAALDEAVKALGGNRSEFVRMAVDDRLKSMARVLSALEGNAVPSSDYHDETALSTTDESEASESTV